MQDSEIRRPWTLMRILFGVLLGCAWMLPNHSDPWKSFLAEAWVVAALVAAAFYVSGRSKAVAVAREPLILVSLALTPWVQYYSGLIPFSGQALMVFAYIGAAALAWVVGSEVERISPGLVGDMLFSALGVAAVLSVGLALYQWLGLSDPFDMNIWVVVSGYSGRSVANLGQPNQLGSLLVIGIAACVWGVWRGYFGKSVAALVIVFLMMGIILTQSRAALLEVAILSAAAWIWRRHFDDKRLIICIALALVVLTLCFFNINAAEHLLRLPMQAGIAERTTGEPRPQQWLMLLNGALRSPWWGYGWNVVVPAEINADYFPKSLHGMIFAQSHNIFVDFMVWLGIPFGIFVSALFVIWFFQVCRGLQLPKTIIYFLPLLVLLVHSMLEYPLHYAYFLVPFAVFAGAIRQVQGAPSVIILARPAVWAACAIAATLWWVIFADCLAVERRYVLLQLKISNINVESSVAAAQPVRVLNQMQALIDFSGEDLSQPLSDEKLQWMRSIIDFHPSFRNMLTYAAAIGLKGNVQGSRDWLLKTCQLSPDAQCLAIADRWSVYQERFPVLRAVSAK